MLHDAGFVCGFCGEWNETTVDASAGEGQRYVEDCQVCCRPNVLEVRIDLDEGTQVVTATFEG